MNPLERVWRLPRHGDARYESRWWCDSCDTDWPDEGLITGLFIEHLLVVHHVPDTYQYAGHRKTIRPHRYDWTFPNGVHALEIQTRIKGLPKLKTYTSHAEWKRDNDRIRR